MAEEPENTKPDGDESRLELPRLTFRRDPRSWRLASGECQLGTFPACEVRDGDIGEGLGF